ncbi:Protein YIM1 [Lachnellula willkommii]|uniref:Protein YIM1 n=1 Tax=Lachnellula willkommii TaxID=215461 RepID=A0A559MJR9_9HELO|nr:Protein YIM1 [Lachnellula willkommii]
MRAAVLTSQGDPNVLAIQEHYTKPQLSTDHGVLVKVKAIAISSADLMTRRGFTAGPVITPPKIIGSECIGIVEAVSKELERLDDQVMETLDGLHGAKYRVGDVVVGLMGGMGRSLDGCYAEYVALPPRCLSAPLTMLNATSLPMTSDSSPSFGLLAAIPGAFLAAHGILIKSLQVQSTDTLLVQGGSSAVGMAIASISKGLCGLNKIIGTTRSQDKVTKMKAAGFDTVVVLPREAIPSPAKELAGIVKEKGGELSGFTAIIDLIGATNVPVSLLCANLSGGSRVCMAGMLAGAYHFEEPFSPMGIVSVRTY